MIIGLPYLNLVMAYIKENNVKTFQCLQQFLTASELADDALLYPQIKTGIAASEQNGNAHLYF